MGNAKKKRGILGRIIYLGFEVQLKGLFFKNVRAVIVLDRSRDAALSRRGRDAWHVERGSRLVVEEKSWVGRGNSRPYEDLVLIRLPLHRSLERVTCYVDGGPCVLVESCRVFSEKL